MPCHRSAAIFSFVILFMFSAAFAASNVVEYKRDAAGNIIEMKRQSPGGFAITGFDPSSGAVGTTVTIYGAGFGSTPSSNAVAFNGTAATVSASAAGSISTTVPTGATTGRITVTVGGVTVTSAQDFVVVIPGAPVITGFTPIKGPAGTTVVVSGSNFTTSGMTAKLNGVVATQSAVTTTQFSLAVPTATGSGRITATTGVGTGLSAHDFVVPPLGVNVNDIATTVRLVVGGPSVNVAVGAANTHALALFDLQADTYYTIQLNSLAFSPSTASIPYTIIKPDNSTIAPGGSVGANNRPTIHLPKLAVAGTYGLLISPSLATFNSNLRLVADPVLPLDGAASALAGQAPNQSLRMVVAGTTGERIGVGILGFTLSAGNWPATPFIAYNPDGTQIGAGMAGCVTSNQYNLQANCDGEIVATTSGDHTVIARAPSGATMSFSAQASSDVAGSLTPDVGVIVALTRVGQDSRHTFAGSFGDSFGVAISSVALQPQHQGLATSVTKPDGTTLAGRAFAPSTAGYVELGTLAAAGSYSVALDPNDGAYGTARLTLKQGALLTTSQSPAAFAPSTTSEVARFRFNATAGDNLAAGVSGLTGGTADLSVYGPSRVIVGNPASCLPSLAGGRCKVSLANIPSTGVYSLVVVPSAGVQIAGSASVSSDVSGALAAGVPQTISMTREAQNGRFTFSGTAGDSTSVKLWGVVTTPASQNVALSTYRPDGGLVSGASVASSAVLPLGILPSTGTYTVLIGTTYGTPWQGSLALDPGTAMTVDGTTATLASAAGEPLRYRFAGTAGQRLEVGVGGLTYSSATAATTSVTVHHPTGPAQQTASCSTANAGGCELTFTSLPVTGIYTVSVVPPTIPDLTGGQLALSTPATGTFAIGGGAQSVAISRPGQTARYTFSGSSGQLLRLSWGAPTVSNTSAVSISVLNPDGSTLTSGSLVNGTANGFDIASLPATGTYTAVLNPAWAATLSASMTLATR